jgi:hypothetical protein
MFFRILYLTFILSALLAYQGVIAIPTSKDKQSVGGGDAPPSCPEDKPDKQSGLCYKKCAEGYHGVGPVCWKNKGIGSYGRGVGFDPVVYKPVMIRNP